MAASNAKRAQVAERRAAAIRLRVAGLDWEDIAKQLGYRTRGAACQDVTRAMERHVAAEGAAVEVLRDLQISRQNRLLAGLWTAATGGLRELKPDGTPGARIPADPQAAEVCRKIVMDQIKTLGLAAPQRHELLSMGDLDAQLILLEKALADSE